MVEQDGKPTGEVVSEDAALALFEHVLSCDALLTSDQMFELEEQLTGSGAIAVSRRIGLAMATQDGPWFKQLSEDRSRAVIVAGQLRAVRTCITAMQELASLIDSAATRVEIALCAHSDMHRILVEGKASSLVEFPQEH